MLFYHFYAISNFYLDIQRIRINNTKFTAKPQLSFLVIILQGPAKSFQVPVEFTTWDLLFRFSKRSKSLCEPRTAGEVTGALLWAVGTGFAPALAGFRVGLFYGDSFTRSASAIAREKRHLLHHAVSSRTAGRRDVSVASPPPFAL